MKAISREQSAVLSLFLAVVATGSIALAVVHAGAPSVPIGTDHDTRRLEVGEEKAWGTEEQGRPIMKCHAEGSICSVLGYDFQAAALECKGLDQDIFRFSGREGERVCVRLESDPPEPGVGKRAMLILTNRTLGLRLFRRLNTGLPHGITVTLPETGEYCVVVAESPLTPGDRMCVGERYKGDYCITLEASPETADSFAAAASVEPRREEGISGLI